MEGHLWPEVMDWGSVTGHVEWVCPLMIFPSIPLWNTVHPCLQSTGDKFPFSLFLSALWLTFSFLCSRCLFVMQTHTYAVSSRVERSCVWQDFFCENVAQWKPPAEAAAALSLSSTRDVGIRLHYYQLWARPPHFIDTSCLPEPSKALFLKQTAAFQMPHWLFSLFWWIYLGLRYKGKTGYLKHTEKKIILHILCLHCCALWTRLRLDHFLVPASKTPSNPL